MVNRIELNETDLDKVVGGAFHYNTLPDGSMTCRVDGYGSYGGGTYKCTENAKRKISLYFMNHENASLQDAVNYALQNGYFWN